MNSKLVCIALKHDLFIHRHTLGSWRIVKVISLSKSNNRTIINSHIQSINLTVSKAKKIYKLFHVLYPFKLLMALVIPSFTFILNGFLCLIFPQSNLILIESEIVIYLFCFSFIRSLMMFIANWKLYFVTIFSSSCGYKI